MLRELRVRGFKSLADFHLEINPGLNVLVGPNGAGKTNVLKFLEFLSDLSTFSVSEAVGRAGGAGEIFRRGCASSYSNRIWFEVKGEGRLIAPRLRKGGVDIGTVKYRLEAEIILTENSVFFLSQTIDAWTKEKASKLPDLSISISFDLETNSQRAKIRLTNDAAEKSYMPDETRSYIKNIVENDPLVIEHLVLSFFYGPIPIFRTPLADLRSGKAYNINPTKVRAPEDIARKPGIEFDGGGLASTLLYLKKLSRKKLRDASPNIFLLEDVVSFDQNSLEQIEAFCKLVNDNIVELDATSDFIENKNRVTVKFQLNGDEVDFPISLISDGTAKWFSLMAAIVTSKSAFCIEEPENFIHPRLQEEVVRIARAITEEDPNGERFVLMTTHSQTLLNVLNPKEVIVTNMTTEGTKCSRPSNAEKLEEMINKTGFGLGYFYLTDAVES